MGTKLILLHNNSPIAVALAATFSATPLDLSLNPISWPIEVNTSETRLLVLEGYFLFGRPPLQSARLRHALFAPGVSRSFVILSFLSEEKLKCYPGAALLDEPGVKFQRLPCPRSQIDRACNDAKMFDAEELAGMARRVGTAIGQARWRAQRFVEGLRNAQDNPFPLHCLNELEHFCQRQWPRYFERAFTELRKTIDTKDVARAKEIMDEFSERLIPASVYEAFASFFHGAGKDVNNRGPGPTLAAFSSYTSSAGMTLGSIETYLRERQWWDGFQSAFNNVRQQLEEIRVAGADPDDYLPVHFENLNNALLGFSQFASIFLTKQVDGKTLQRAHQHLSILTEGLTTIARARSSFRSQDQPHRERASIRDRSRKTLRMLFVDDDYIQWIPILEAVARQYRWRIESVGSIEAAQIKLQKNRKNLKQNRTRYDLIVLDLGFPNQSIQGHCGVRKLHDEAKTIPIIVLTASNSAADIRTAVECLNQGAWEYFTKPDVNWLKLMEEADNLSAAGQLIRDRIQILKKIETVAT